MTLLVPLGSTEQHGPHLPLETDTIIAAAIANAAARERPSVIVAPAVPYGASGEHEGFSGTISIGTEALTLLLVELARSALTPTGRFERLIFVNGHGGNTDALRHAFKILDFEGRKVQMWWPQPVPGEVHDAHAGHTETSLMLALAPQLVRLDRLEPGNEMPLKNLLPQLRAAGIRAIAPNGILGNPVGATAEKGRSLLAAYVVQLLTAINR